MHRVIGVLFVGFVLAAVAFAFSPRSDPPMPLTQVRIGHLQMLDVAAREDGRLIAVGERGHIFVSDDRGTAWRAAQTPSTTTLTAVRFVDAQRVVAVGHDALILRSDDGGESWSEVQRDAEAEEPLLGVWLDEGGRGFAVGAYGRFELTVDGGASWERRELEANEEALHLNAIVRVDEDVFVIAGEAGTLLRSQDGGATWQALASPYSGSYFGALALPRGAVLVYGMRGHVFRSDDGGETWQEVATEVQGSLFGGRVLGDGRVVLVGQNGVVLVSEDEGRSFVRVERVDRRTRAALAEAGADEVVLVGEEGADRLPLPRVDGGRS
ncbi:MAG TPA: YCF48-related protein [Thauera sp.]|uniref:WD40/YVTN/BNR-like repeat-containing protein n=1 Tax=Thauera sp. TaxID=1905334 RepID=UPI002C275CF6|nr:YCF48-related protein [Thauera sp.]HRP22506.1 YCF48-related protein [Thauera sp.]HRP65156.1 YCF48-related protein [Thauera sp.]